jgi:hypothetical protein
MIKKLWKDFCWNVEYYWDKLGKKIKDLVRG